MAWAPDYVTLSDLKSFLGIPDTNDDAQLSLAITTASRSIDTHCNRQFGNVTTTRSYGQCWVDNSVSGKTYWSTYVGYDQISYFPIDDMMTISGLVVIADGVTLTSSGYSLLPLNAAADGVPWTHMALASPAARLDITATFGWTAVPSSVKQATLLQASRNFNRRNSPYGVAGSPDMGSELRLLAKVDPDVAVSLKGFTRLRRVA